MRNLKRFLAMTLTMLMVIGCFSFASFAQTFDDVSEYQTAIDVLSDLGVVWGYEDGTFGPDDAVQRWHMALWIAKMETGKTTTDDYLTIWRAEENYTDFTDVAVDQAIGAINYASDEVIIIGTSATTFAPTAGIMYQDALTMVVRALGFGGKAMDAGYPWKYINKAAELGLEDGLTGIAYKSVLTRAQTAQILYNALYTVDADGNCYVADVFGLSTVVITGTPAYKMIQSEAVIKTGFVSFNILNGDGTINSDVTYHLPATAFGLTAANADTYVGASFKVTTEDNFKSLGVVLENPSASFDAAKIVGAGKADAASSLLTLDGTSYQAVSKYSTLYNAQGIKGNTDEILVYTTNVAQKTTDGYFKVDANYNVLNATGQIVAYYAPAITGSYATPYAKLLGNNAYVTFANNNDNQKAAIEAAGGVWNLAAVAMYAQTVANTYDLVVNNKYATAKAYDDNADGKYDRLFYTYQEFWNISYDAGTLKYNVNGPTNAAVQVSVNRILDGATGATLTAVPAGYSRYSYNPLSKFLTVYETYVPGTGLVTTVNTLTSKIVIGGTIYSVGIGTFPGAAYSANPSVDETGVSVSLIGKQVNFILVDGIVVRAFGIPTDTKIIVYDNMTGITSQGYGTALAYVQSPTASVITIATVNGYSYQQYLLLADHDSLQNIMPLETGDLFNGTKDALGFWHLTTLDYNYKSYTVNGQSGRGWINFKNGIGTPVADTIIPAMGQFETTAETLFIAYTPWDDAGGEGRFVTYKGIPDNDSNLQFFNNMYAVLDKATVPGATTASFVYVNYGWLVFKQVSLPAFTNDTVVYVNKSAVPTVVTDNIGTTGTLLGNTYQYGNVLDMLTGKLITVQVNYNFRLTPGAFYRVYNGYVEVETKPNIATSWGIIDITTGWLNKYGPYSSEIDTGGTQAADVIEPSAKTYIYKLVNGDVVLDANGALVNSALVAPLAKLDSKVFFYTGDFFDWGYHQRRSNVMLIDETVTDPYVAPAPVVIGGSVHIDGSLYVGRTLTADISDILPAGAQVTGKLTYQWMKATLLNGTYTAIAGATAKTYKLLADDLIGYIKVVVTGVAPDFSGSVASVPVGPILAAEIQVITYDINTGDHGVMAVTEAHTDASVALRLNTFTKHGYSFAGWDTEADGSGTNYTDEQIILMPLGGLELFAQWTADPQTIIFNANTGVGTMANQVAVTDASITLTANTFTKAGYSFAGWNTAVNGSGDAYANSEAITMPVGGLNLFAQWTALSQTITYNKNGGSGAAMADTVAVTDAIVTLTANTYVGPHPHHTFIDWNTAADGSGFTYTDAQILAMPAGGLTLYAQYGH